MKMFKKLLTLVLTVALSLSCMGQVKAADVKESYTYKVTLYAGNRGEFNANAVTVDNTNAKITETADKIVIEDLEAGDKVSISQNSVNVTDEKYYVKGIRLSGRDNDEATTLFEVKKDVDYVVAYGIKGNQVAYTVNYVDVDGNVLAESDTFYGNIGDKPVVAYKYIEGYVPEVYGFTKTLSENADENVFTFVYDEAPTPSIIIENVGGTGEGGQGDQDNAGQAGNAGQDGQGNAGQTGNDDQGNAGQDNQGDDGNDDTIVDLDDEQTPGGNIDVDSSNIGMVGSIAIAVAAAVALFVLIFAFMKKRKENTQ